MERDTAALHAAIDPYQLLLRKYRILETDVAMRDADLVQFLRSFLVENGIISMRNHGNVIIGRLLSRLRTDYAHSINERDDDLRITFVVR